MNSKQRAISPISCKSSGKLVKKYIHKEAYQKNNANNNLLHKLRDYSSKHWLIIIIYFFMYCIY